ncbi:MAG TPA: ferritin-like domain-containing protein [Sedimenticola sp.]|nr:ferritin-like domain-containing protein [Sedimenticola sp.]
MKGNGMDVEPARNLFQLAHDCLTASGVERKLALALALRRGWRAGTLAVQPVALEAVAVAGRPPRPELVPPRELPRRSPATAEGRLALIHAVAHIEFNAINLACDAICRFQAMPVAYHGDWAGVAAEEAEHFTRVRDLLRARGRDYGDFPAHDGLWEMARRTAADPLTRMALVPRMLEARGLDVTPGMIRRFDAAGDRETVAVLEVILREEVGHVAIGSRWFRHLCGERGLVPETTYLRLLDEFLNGGIRCPLNREARLRAGFSEGELTQLEARCGGRGR